MIVNMKITKVEKCDALRGMFSKCKVKDMDTLQTRDCNIITLHFHMIKKKKKRKEDSGKPILDGSCFIFPLSENSRSPGTRVERWQYKTWLQSQTLCCAFIWVTAQQKEPLLCVYLFIYISVYVWLAFTGKNLLLNFLGKKDFPLRQRYIICFYPLTRKTHQSFLAWLHIVGNSNLDNKLCWIEPFVEILACHIDRIFEEIIAHFNEMKKKNIAWCTHTVFPITCTDTPTVIVGNGKCLLFASNGLDLNIIESEFN